MQIFIIGCIVSIFLFGWWIIKDIERKNRIQDRIDMIRIVELPKMYLALEYEENKEMVNRNQNDPTNEGLSRIKALEKIIDELNNEMDKLRDEYFKYYFPFRRN